MKINSISVETEHGAFVVNLSDDGELIFLELSTNLAKAMNNEGLKNLFLHLVASVTSDG